MQLLEQRGKSAVIFELQGSLFFVQRISFI